jgi:outer membrane protein insertion porin family
MQKYVVSLLALLAAGSPVLAQDAAPGVCTTPDTIVVSGNARVTGETIRASAALAPRTTLNFRDVQRAIKALFATGQFEDVQVLCTVPPAAPRTTLTIAVRERPLLYSFTVTGPDRVSPKDVRERLALASGRPLDPAALALAVERTDSLYESKGYYLARVRVDTIPDGEGKVKIAFTVEEGRRLAISGLQVTGN